MRSLLTLQLLLAVWVGLACSITRIHAVSFSQRMASARSAQTDDFQSLIAKVATPVKRELNAFELCLCGAFATVVGDFVMHPIDTIKVTQQTAVAAISFFTAVKQVFATSGLMGFYQGVVPYLICDGNSGAVKFAVFETSKKFLQEKLPAKYHSSLQFACAAVAMLACSVILVPGEVVKTRMQAGAGSMVEVISQTLKNEGVKGLFSGYYATLVRDVPYTMLELGVYENVKSFMRKMGSSEGADERELTQNDELMAAAFTGAVAAFLTTPLDLVKTKLMMQGAGGLQYAGVADALAR
jgi:solute carrier family 25 S-adenosylmethionine transporter 26